ncbi:MAG TPA: Na+/H+ antiporter subunit E [Acidimicrobiales bacterium]|nr:Na+/H+ antiporter subunit E [Acidimicrobiales bacterium]
MTRLLHVVTLTAIWLALWSDMSTANVLSGVLLACAIGLFFGTWRTGTVVVRPLDAARFALYFVAKLVQATVTVARAVIAPRHRVHTGIVAVPLRGCSDAVATLIADAISLTPGTLTLELRRRPLTLFVHALDVRDVEQVQADVRRLEVLALKAFGPPAALSGLDVDDTTSWECT